MSTKPKLRFQGVTWNIPSEIWDGLQKAKTSGQENLDVPAACTNEEFACFILSVGLAAYAKTTEASQPEPLIMTPDQYVGSRTPKR